MPSCLEVVQKQVHEFSERRLESLFSYYASDMKVYVIEPPQHLLALLSNLKSHNLGASETSISKILHLKLTSMVEDISILKAHVKNQFEAASSMSLKNIVEYAYKDFVVTIEEKKISEKTIHAIALYQVANGKIVSIWQSRLSPEEFAKATNS